MRVWSTVLVLLAACGFPRPPDLPGPGDDASVPPADASLCFGTFVRVCFDSTANIPTQPQHFGDDGHAVLISTDVASVCDQHNDQKSTYCVVTGAGLTFAQTISFSARGSKALVLLSTAAVDVRGAIDVSAGIGKAAGADPPGGCTGATAVQGDSGGAGGSFAGRGGSGGIVDAPVGSSAAAPALTAFSATLRGGCSGQAGNGAGSPASPSGGGGGAIAIIAPSLTLDATINASGEGGSGGTTSFTGGGGGGSGGMIVLDIPITGISRGPNGFLVANGGGGGEGGDGGGTAPGMTPFRPTPAASGGGTGPTAPGNLAGGKGGDGSAGAALNGATSPGGVQNGGGGGGGGGGAGFIHAPGITGDSVISPPSRDLP